MRPENPIGEPFFELSEVDSTNNYAMRQAQSQMAVHGTTWFAEYQNAGKGQRGKAWNGEPGQNIAMSVLIEPGFLAIDNQFLLNISVALACYDFFTDYTIDKTSVKWPNDLYWNDRKAGGILIENIIHGKEWRFAVVGIGININQTLFPANLPNPVSLKQITGKNYNTVSLAKQICNKLETRWENLLSANPTDLLNEYNSRLYKLNQPVTFSRNSTPLEAIIAGVNEKGDLIDAKNNSVIPYGSVSWVLT